MGLGTNVGATLAVALDAVVLRPGQSATAEALIAFVNGKLAGYKKLHYVEFIDIIPKVPSGKILRRELKERERALRAGRLP